MQSKKVLILHSNSTKAYARRIGIEYEDPIFLCVSGTPKEYVTTIPNKYDLVIGIGGGSVIDMAKIIAGDQRALVIPTTAAGAAMTSYATVWGATKRSITTRKPIVKTPKYSEIKLDTTIQIATMFDALSHSFECLWSKHSTARSNILSILAIQNIGKFYTAGNIKKLIIGGNYAGQAIEIVETNIVHAITYPLTLKYGMSHGIACALVLPYFIDYFGDCGMHKYFKHKDLSSLVWHLKQNFPAYSVNIKELAVDWKYVVHEAFKYSKSSNTVMNLDENVVYELLSELIQECV
ncbi:hypothetical protein LCGC14_0306250 [marine sediment metagenome]|uniref:Fe-containing alcohol dehydrogenase-like C-terminal domain-containing protein n=1 Tax=marine sediment metagenome TaxID=412755 RepID=A0A0F9WAR1_9ZZZZ